MKIIKRYISANLHYLTPPRQNLIWASLHPEYSKERFSYIISETFLGRICWSGDIPGLSEEQLEEMFKAERFYEEVSHIIKRGDSYIFRTDECSFHSPTGIQTVIRYSEDKTEALVVIHRFDNSGTAEFPLYGDYSIAKKLYPDNTQIADRKLILHREKDFSGNVYRLVKV